MLKKDVVTKINTTTDAYEYACTFTGDKVDLLDVYTTDPMKQVTIDFNTGIYSITGNPTQKITGHTTLVVRPISTKFYFEVSNCTNDVGKFSFKRWTHSGIEKTKVEREK